MKILIITDYLYPQTHGIAVRMENIVKNLRCLNYNVDVYGSYRCNTANKKLLSIPLLYNKDVYICLPSFQLIYDILSDYYDVIHIVYPSFIGVILSIWLPLFRFVFHFKTRIVSTNHVALIEYNQKYNYRFVQPICYSIIKHLIYMPQLYLCDEICAVSHYIDVETFFSKKVTIVRSGVDTKIFSFSDQPRKNVLLYVGRISIEKRLDVLIKTFLEFNKNEKKYELWIIGFGDFEKKIKKNIDSVKFFGKRKQKELPFFYQQARAHITFSETETFGLTILESLSCGTPVIYPDCKVLNSLYKEEFPDLCFTQNLHEIIHYIEINEDMLRKKCKRFITNYTWENATQSLIDVYEAR